MPRAAPMLNWSAPPPGSSQPGEPSRMRICPTFNLPDPATGSNADQGMGTSPPWMNPQDTGSPVTRLISSAAIGCGGLEASQINKLCCSTRPPFASLGVVSYHCLTTLLPLSYQWGVWNSPKTTLSGVQWLFSTTSWEQQCLSIANHKTPRIPQKPAGFLHVQIQGFNARTTRSGRSLLIPPSEGGVPFSAEGDVRRADSASTNQDSLGCTHHLHDVLKQDGFVTLANRQGVVGSHSPAHGGAEGRKNRVLFSPFALPGPAADLPSNCHQMSPDCS